MEEAIDPAVRLCLVLDDSARATARTALPSSRPARGSARHARTDSGNDSVLLRLTRVMDDGVARRPVTDGPPPHLGALLPLLASGETDAAAAAAVGISERTYSRRVAELMQLLGARSRFQAGAEAVRRGWL